MNAPIDISRVILNTERLVLRPWREADLEDFYEYATKHNAVLDKENW